MDYNRRKEYATGVVTSISNFDVCQYLDISTLRIGGQNTNLKNRVCFVCYLMLLSHAFGDNPIDAI